MEAILGSRSENPYVLCVGLPDRSVAKIASLLGNGVIVTSATDTSSAAKALAAHAIKASGNVAVATTRDTSGVPYTSLIRVDLNARRALANDMDLRLSPLEFDLLAVLYSNPDQAWSYEELSNQVWGQPYLGDSGTISTAVRRLRKRLASIAHVNIAAVRGFGYRLEIKASRPRSAPQADWPSSNDLSGAVE